MSVWLEPGAGQDPPLAVAEIASVRYRLSQAGGRWVLGVHPGAAAPAAPTVHGSPGAGFELTDVAPLVGLDFRQGSFRYGTVNRPLNAEGEYDLDNVVTLTMPKTWRTPWA